MSQAGRSQCEPWCEWGQQFLSRAGAQEAQKGLLRVAYLDLGLSLVRARSEGCVLSSIWVVPATQLHACLQVWQLLGWIGGLGAAHLGPQFLLPPLTLHLGNLRQVSGSSSLSSLICKMRKPQEALPRTVYPTGPLARFPACAHGRAPENRLGLVCSHSFLLL